MILINVMPVMMRRVSSVCQVGGAAMITPEQVGERYLAVHHRMFRTVNDAMSECGLSMARTKVLMRLREQGPTRQSVLAADFGLSPHSITDIVDALERLGMVERRPDATDRRAKLVAITDAGEASLGVAYATRERLLKQVRRPEPGRPGFLPAPARHPGQSGSAADRPVRRSGGLGMIAEPRATIAARTTHASHLGV